jgi:hypothetical protein
MTIIAGHFSILVPGGWIAGYVPSAGLWTQLDQELSQCVNGDGGGTYAPSTAIVVGGSGMQIPSGATWSVLSGGFFHVASGGELYTDAGSSVLFSGTTQWQPGATAAFECPINITAAATLNAGGSLTLAASSGCSVTWGTGTTAVFQGTSTLSIKGSSLIISDTTTNPTYAATRTRNIIQPLMMAGAASGVTCSGFGINDGGAGNSFSIPLTKLINGARLTQIDVPLQIVSSHTPGTALSLSLIRVQGGLGTSGIVNLGIVSGPTGVIGAGQSVTLVISGGGVIIDDSSYFYYLACVAESGASAQPVEWFSPILTFDTIATVGQF